MKKIIILNYGLHISGVSRTLINFANTLVNHGYDVTIKIEIPDFTLLPELDPKVKCSLFLKEPHLLGLRIRGFLRFYDKWVKWLLKLPAQRQYHLVVREKYDIEIAFNRGAAANIISASANRTARKLVWVHSDYMHNNNPLAGFIDLEAAQKGYRKFDQVVCVSQQAMQSFQRKFGEDFPLVTRCNIIDVNRILTWAQESCPMQSDKFVVTAVGRLCEAKNYPLMLNVMKELEHRGCLVECWILGGGEKKEELLSYQESNHIANVKFLGAKTNPYPYIKNADLYLSTSIYEGLSTTTIEALILGKLCMVTPCTGMTNILGENNEYGIVTSFDAKEIADKIQEIINDKALQKYYENKALERAKDFDPELAFRRIEELF